MTGTLIAVRLSELSTDPRFKVREIQQQSFRPHVRQQYVEAMTQGESFPPLVAWKHGRRLIVLAGHHRLAAYQMHQKNYMGGLRASPGKKQKSLPADECYVYIVECGEQEARHIARSENSTHGAPLTNRERRNIYSEARKDPYYAHCSDRYFARMLGVTHGTIQNWRKKKPPRRKKLMSAQEFYEHCVAIAKRGVDCAAAHRHLTRDQLKVIAEVEDLCHKALYGTRTRANSRVGETRVAKLATPA